MTAADSRGRLTIEALQAAARQRVAAGQLELDLGVEPAGGGPLPIRSSRMGSLVNALDRAYRLLGPEDAVGGTTRSGSWS